MKKQKSGIDRSLEKIEKELFILFDQAETDCMEVSVGMLTRHRDRDGVRWTIDI